MIYGIGTDIIEIERIRQSIRRHGLYLLNRLFTPEEQQYCQKHLDASPHFAGRFAAKEAVSKALGCGLGAALSWLDIEILNDENGKPCAYLSKKAQERFGCVSIHLSISHCKQHAQAFAIASKMKTTADS